MQPPFFVELDTPATLIESRFALHTKHQVMSGFFILGARPFDFTVPSGAKVNVTPFMYIDCMAARLVMSFVTNSTRSLPSLSLVAAFACKRG